MHNPTHTREKKPLEHCSCKWSSARTPAHLLRSPILNRPQSSSGQRPRGWGIPDIQYPEQIYINFTMYRVYLFIFFRITDGVVEPLKIDLTDLDQLIKDEEDKIYTKRANVLRNNEKIQKLVHIINSKR